MLYNIKNRKRYCKKQVLTEYEKLAPPILLLLSGLPLMKPTSFSRQLQLLSVTLEDHGFEVLVRGPSASNSGYPVHAALLLGYPDQFPLLLEGGTYDFPLFLWSQLSRPPNTALLGDALPVPLTDMTRQFLQKGGVTRIGPIIPHGVDISRYRPLTTEERLSSRKKWGVHEGFVIGSVGAHSARKRFDLILQTLAILLMRGIEAELLIKTDRIRSLDGIDLKELSRRAGVHRQVSIITGELSDEEMRSVYGSMDIYLNLSEWEGFCIPVVEAMACGIPVACLQAQGPGEIVPYGDLFIHGSRYVDEGGTVLREADVSNAADVVQNAAHEPAMLEDLGRSGAQEARRRYDIRAVTRQWLRLMA